jgi:hypothetical protein
MDKKELKAIVESTTGAVLASMGFQEPVEHHQTETAFELAYVDGDFGVSVEVNTLERYIVTFMYDASVPERFRPAYRDVYGKIQKRYLTEILLTLGLISRKNLEDRNRKLRKLAYTFDEDAKVLCNEEARLLKQWAPHLIPLKESLFGMTTIDGAPANFYV